MTIAIKLQSLCKSYYQGRELTQKSVDNVNLSITKGQVFGLLGPNGAGKTTTIKMICGLVTPSSGHIILNGYDVRQHRSLIMGQIGVVLEGTRNIYWRLSAWQNLMYFGRLKGCSSKHLRVHAEALLRELDLWERRNDPVGQFSRGMQQKVAIACALINDPAIVLLDEPTLGLDVQAARTVKAWIATLSQDRGKTVVITSHELAMVQEVCHRVAIMRNGHIIADKPVPELLALFREEYYRIKIGASCSKESLACFDGLTITTEGQSTVLAGAITDQTTLHQVLNQIASLGLPLVSVHRVEPNLEEVFVRLTHMHAKGDER